MFRATVNYGRKGLPVQAISAVDLAIWDLLGHIRDEPVWVSVVPLEAHTRGQRFNRFPSDHLLHKSAHDFRF